jgi:rhodanese-related sulfurtransferase
MKNIVLEGLVVAVLGAGLALLANALSPQGLQLTRNYDKRNPPVVSVATNATAVPGATNFPSPSEVLAAELKAQGLQLAGSNQVLRLFHDPGLAQGLIAFVDARHPEEYAQGHIPGAYLMDFAHPQKYIPEVLPVCTQALQVVVYCNGGECNDSEQIAITLRELGVLNERLCVYGGGITEWKANGWPIQTGSQRR